MARLPGLTPHYEDRPQAGGRNKSRVPVDGPNVRPQRLSPTANPVSTYARPPAPPSTNRWLQLAESLSAISPGLQQMLHEQAEARKQEAEDLANRRLGGMSFEEAQRAVKDGSIPEMSNPWFKAAFMKQYGERLAHKRASEIAAIYETEFDKENGNLDQFIAERMKEDLDAHGDNRFFVSSYLGVMNRFNVSAQAKHQEYLAGRTKDETFQGAYETFLGTARQLMEEGATPVQIATALREKYEGNRELLNIPYKEQDREMLRVAQALAEEGHFEIVKALLTTERTAADGTKLGPLANNREFSADAARILQRAERVMFDNNEKESFDKRMGFFDQSFTGKLDREELETWHKENPGALTDSQVQTLISRNQSVIEQTQKEAEQQRMKLLLEQQSARSHEALEQADLAAAEAGLAPFLEDGVVLDEKGEPKIISSEKRKEALADNLVERFRQRVETNQITPEQAFEAEVKVFTANNLTHPQWKSVLGAGGVSAATFAISGGEVPPALKEGAELYMRLHAQNPRLLQQHIPDAATRDYYEAYRIAKQYGRMNDSQAYQQASTLTNDPDKYESVYMRQRYDDIDKAVKDLRSNGFVRFFGLGTASADNAGYVGNEISRVAQFYARNGLGATEAIEEAKKRFQETHHQINGWWIYTADRDVPPDFEKLVGSAIADYVTEFGEDEGLDADDLSIRPATNGTGAWQIINRHTGAPVENSERRYITNRSLIEAERDRIEKRRQEVIEETNRQIEAGRYDPWLVINENTYFGPFLSNPSKEEQEYVNRRAREIHQERQKQR